jgi:hypothetical protein
VPDRLPNTSIVSRLARAGVLLASVAALALPPAAAEAAASAQAPVYWGAHIGNLFGFHSEAPWNMANASALAASVGKAPSLIEFGIWWYGCDSGRCRLNPFPTAQLQATRTYGAIPVLSWASGSESAPYAPTYPLAAIAAGRYDSYLANWAVAARRWHHPLFLRFDWEMNIPGLWGWSPGVGGNTARGYVAAWRHVHDVFVSNGALNVTWVWCPNVEYPTSSKPLAALYPGSAYVDWVCLDGYNWGANPRAVAGSSWRSFGQIFQPTYNRLTRTLAPGKPVMIAETASSEIGGSKAAWIADAFTTQLPRNLPRVKAVMWYDAVNSDGMDWPLSTSPEALQAFAGAIDSPRYAANRYARISEAPIRPPPSR